jgi:hypothetical protein
VYSLKIEKRYQISLIEYPINKSSWCNRAVDKCSVVATEDDTTIQLPPLTSPGAQLSSRWGDGIGGRSERHLCSLGGGAALERVALAS